MPTRNVNLTDHYDQFVEISISEGRFANASEVMRAGLALLERQDAEDKARLEWLRGAVQEGLDSFDRGEGIVLSSPEEIDRFIEDIVAETRSRVRV